MALDEALLLLPAERPTLRFYTWRPAALSLGYFQRCADVPELERASMVVRRLTGGGAIHHEHELTFSIAASEAHPLYAGPVRRSYERVHLLLARALADFGVRARLRGAGALASDRTGGGMCFEHSTDLDLAWDDAKGVGSAQRRRGGRVLHHGSIKLDRSDLDTRVATLRDRHPGASPTAVAEVIQALLARELGVRLVPEEPTDEERAHVAARAGHFTSAAFVRRR